MASEILLYGACDRHNLGDLLFPWLWRRLLGIIEPGTPSTVVGLTESDLGWAGGLPTESLAAVRRRLRQSEDDARLVLIGGQLTEARLPIALAQILPQPVARNMARPHNQGDDQLPLARQLSGLPFDYPYIPPRRDNPFAAIVAHAIGGCRLDSLPAADQATLGERLAGYDHVSVRDATSQNLFAKAGIEATLLPDMACLTPSLLGRRYVGAPRPAEGLLSGDYAVVQISQWALQNAGMAAFAEAVAGLSRATGLPLALLPIGRASMHEDQVGLAALSRHLGDVPHELVSRAGIFAICRVLANAKLYCGTSLHGWILAMAHAVPRVGIAADAKLRAYAETWDLASQTVGDVAAIGEGASRALSEGADALANQQTAVHAAYQQGFADVAAAVGGEPAASRWRRYVAKHPGG